MLLKPTHFLSPLNGINLDNKTENFSHRFYMNYFNQWPELNRLHVNWDGKPMGYIMGKVEDYAPQEEDSWHGHVTVLTVNPLFRRIGVASVLMNDFEANCKKYHNTPFIDLFVRESNEDARQMYYSLGYYDFRRVLCYYTEPPEAALDMRKYFSPLHVPKPTYSIHVSQLP